MVKSSSCCIRNITPGWGWCDERRKKRGAKKNGKWVWEGELHSEMRQQKKVRKRRERSEKAGIQSEIEGGKQSREDSAKPEKQQLFCNSNCHIKGTDSVTSGVVKQKDLSAKPPLWKMSISNQPWQPLWEVNELSGSGVTKCNLLGSQFLWRYDECACARGEYWSALLVSENVGVGGAVALPLRLKKEREGEGERPQDGEGLL